jgi:hypothetical protein
MNMDDEQLIEAVRNHSALYDLAQPAYRNIDCKENSWKKYLQHCRSQVFILFMYDSSTFNVVGCTVGVLQTRGK